MREFVESRFTAPRPDCPNPERWHAPDDQSTEVEVTALVAAMVTALQPDFVLETGTCRGSTTEAIGRALRANGQGKLVSLEVDPECVAFARRRCVGLPVCILATSSMDYIPSCPIDFAFFDSLASLRALEFVRYARWMHDRTVVGFHDTGPQHTVRERLKHLEEEGMLVSPLYLPTPRGVMFARVRT
ncbi:MAG: O-methyltransferase [Gemmatimonadetes bacterium]|nr:O-methyltransferase [Gemmatimonadota bacterium]